MVSHIQLLQYLKHQWQRLGAIVFIASSGLTVSPTLAQGNLGRTLLQQVGQCVQQDIIRQRLFSQEALELASMNCTFRVVVLTPEGKVRQDAEARMLALVQASGAQVPLPDSQGRAMVPLTVLPGDDVFTVPVRIGNQTYPFLVDTGASSSIIDSQIARRLGLRGTQIPSRLLSYMVVGNDCTNVKATVHPLPTLQVGNATVRGLRGMGLERKDIPGRLGGVLGMDFLSGFDVMINPRSRQLQLSPPTPLSKTGIPLQGKMGLMTVSVQINGRGPFTLALDTGATWMVLSPALARRLQINIAAAEPMEVQGFCGSETGKLVTLNQVLIQTHQVNQLQAIVLLNSEPLDLLQVDGIVGQNFLNRYQQRWQFGQRSPLGYPTSGRLELIPLRP
ncbi:MAG: retropepsin-like aspartic protease [Cyanobacteriota bacterium SKYGB_h_bin112]|nr:retropepsin-like aspartic protease [Cyanobacteriota bacterium SKYGB_h_bin112]